MNGQRLSRRPNLNWLELEGSLIWYSGVSQSPFREELPGVFRVRMTDERVTLPPAGPELTLILRR